MAQSFSPMPGLPEMLAKLTRRPAPSPRALPDTPDETRQAQLREMVERGYRPDEKQAQVIATVQQRFENARAAKVTRHEEWATCEAFYAGDHYRVWDPRTSSLTTVAPDSEHRVRIKDNQITQVVLTIASKRAKARHVTQGVPNNPQDEQDVAAAGLTTKLLRHVDRITEKPLKRMELELLSTIHGTAFTYCYWDPTAKTQLALQDPRTGAVRGHEIHAGDLNWECLSVWQVFPQPVTEWRKVRWCVIERTFDPEWVRQNFELGVLVAPEASSPEELRTTAGYQRRPAPSGQTPQVRVREYFELPSRLYPEGRWAVVSGGVLLHYEERTPIQGGRLPVVPYYGIWLPQDLWGKGWVWDLVDQQRYLNRVESGILENHNLMARPKWLVPVEANLAEDALHDGPGEVVEYSGGQRPEAHTPSFGAREPLELKNSIVDNIRNIAGVHDVSLGDTPSGLSSGVAIDLVAQADEGRLSIPVAFAAHAWRETDTNLTLLAQEHYTVPRLVRVLGKDQDEEAISFLGTDLQGNTEVDLQPVEGVSDSIAALRQRVLDYKGAGLLDLPPDLQVELYTLMNEQQLADFARGLVQREEERAAAVAEAEAAAAAEEEAALTDEEDALAAQEAGGMLGELLVDADGNGAPDQPGGPMPGGMPMGQPPMPMPGMPPEAM